MIQRIFISAFVIFFLTMELVPHVFLSMDQDTIEMKECCDGEAEKEGKEIKQSREADEYLGHSLLNNVSCYDAVFVSFKDHSDQYLKPVLEGPLMPPELA